MDLHSQFYVYYIISLIFLVDVFLYSIKYLMSVTSKKKLRKRQHKCIKTKKKTWKNMTACPRTFTRCVVQDLALELGLIL